MALTADQISIIKQTTPILEDHGIALCQLFYKNLLSDNNALNAVFSQTNQQSGAQPRALAGSLLAYAQNIDNLSALGPAVERICQKHASMYIQPEQYATVGEYLLAAMAQLLGPATFTDDVKNAWTAAYWQIANLMMTREKQLYESDPAWNGWRGFVVAEKVVEAEGMLSLTLRPQDGKELPDYHPGQFISVNVEVPQLGYKQTRQFSLSDRPYPDHYRVSVKKDQSSNQGQGCVGLPDGVVSNIIHDHTRLGDIIEVSKPRGVFFVDVKQETDRPLALISAGSGVTPMVAILESLAAKRSRRSVRWIHVTRNSKAHAFKDRIRELASQLGAVEVRTIYSRPLPEDEQGQDYSISGRVSSSELVGEDIPTHAECCVCGPSKFMDDVSAELRNRGVPEQAIKMELFGTGGLPEPRG
ncbi:MAG: hypothetical protein Q9159_001492 [Coniocarpon cinnabarinum]